jgi:hypothetical protein
MKHRKTDPGYRYRSETSACPGLLKGYRQSSFSFQRARQIGTANEPAFAIYVSLRKPKYRSWFKPRFACLALGHGASAVDMYCTNSHDPNSFTLAGIGAKATKF